MAMAGGMGTRTGVAETAPGVATPSWPTPFQPHVHTEPSSSRAALWYQPAAYWRMLVKPAGVTGVRLSAVALLPRVPRAFHPQALGVTVPGPEGVKRAKPMAE